eukprot:XP_011425843.1 PREDICTED: uncharacterized protein LOC105327213 isoform X1 [Crassostrea gigas]
MGTPNWATYFDGVEPDYPGRVREERDYGYCPKQTQDTRRRKQGVVLPEDAFTLQDLEIIPSATGGHFTSGSINRTSGSLPRSPLQSPNYSSSSVFSDFQCSSPVSVNQGRALPPIPVEGTGSKNSGSVRSCNGRFPSRNPLEMKLSPTYSNRELPNIPTDQRQHSLNDSKSNRKKRHGGKSSSRTRKKPGHHEQEPDVVLTVTSRNKRHTHRSHHMEMLNNNIDDGFISAFATKKPLESTLSRERAAKEAEKITVPLRSRMRKSRKRCLVPMVIITILILSGLLSAVIFILVNPIQKDSSSSQEKDGLGMIQAITHMRVLNKPFVIQMSNSSSVEFLQFSSVFEDDINEVFLRSNISTYFYGTNVDALRNGSIYTHSDIFFQDVEPLRDPSVFVSTLRDSSSPITYKSIKAVRFGDNIVDYNSIHVDLSFITVDKYPEKPTLKGETEVMHAIEESTKPKSPSSNIPETNEKAKAPVFIPDFRRKKPPIRMQLPTTAPSVVEEGEPEVIKQEPEIEPKQNKIRPEKETTMTPVVTQTISTPNPTTFSSTIHSAGIGSTISTDTTLKVTTTAPTTVTTKSTTTTTEKAFTATKTTVDMDSSKIQTSVSGDKELSKTTVTPTKSTVGTPYVKVTTKVNDTDGTTPQNATVVCSFGNMDGWKLLTIQNTPLKGKPYVIMNLASNERITIPKELKERLHLNMDVNRSSGTIRISFLLECSDLGRYVCKVHKGDYSYQGGQDLKLLPTKPRLTLPVEIIEGKPITEPILCHMNVGYPPAEYLWMFKSRGQTSFINIGNHDNNPDSRGACGQIKTLHLQMTQTDFLHEVQLKCVLETVNPRGPPKVLEDVATIKVVPKTVCNGVPDNTTIKHPHTCDKYILCRRPDIQVLPCPDSLCFDPHTKRCGQTGLEMSSADAYLNEGVTLLSCRLLHVGTWTSISVFKHGAEGSRSRVLVAYNDSNTPVIEKEVSNRLRATTDRPSKYEVVITLWMYSLGCEDEGEFSCTADVPFAVPEAFGRLNIIAKPDVPSVMLPTEIIDGREPREWVRCTGNVGYPKGKMYWEIRMKGEKEFSKQFPFQTKRDSENTTNCKTYVTNEFRFTPNAKHDGMEVRCVVENPDTMPDGRRLYTTQEIHVIPGNFCEGVSRDKRPHPNNCHQYIQCHDGYTYVQRCSIGLCFNTDTQDCDIRQKEEEEVIDPDFPCKPNRNGVYFPHKSLCNKYIWCVQGQEVIQHCPLGTQYFKDGQCTFEEDKFHCSKAA